MKKRYGLEVTMYNRKRYVVIEHKWFASEKSRSKWLEKSKDDIIDIWSQTVDLVAPELKIERV